MYSCHLFLISSASVRSPILWPPHAKIDSLERPWFWEVLGAAGEGDNRGWDGWMASRTWWMWVWVSLGVGDGQGSLVCCNSWGSQRVRHDWTTELNWWRGGLWIYLSYHLQCIFFFKFVPHAGAVIHQLKYLPLWRYFPAQLFKLMLLRGQMLEIPMLLVCWHHFSPHLYYTLLLYIQLLISSFPLRSGVAEGEGLLNSATMNIHKCIGVLLECSYGAKR